MTYYVLHLKDSDGILMNHAKEVYFYLPELNNNNNTIVKQNISVCACEYCLIPYIIYLFQCCYMLENVTRRSSQR